MQSTKNCSYNCTICIEWVHSTQPQLRTSEVQYSRLYTSLERLIELRPGGLSSIKSVLDLCTSLEYCTLLRSYNIGLCIISTWLLRRKKCDSYFCSSAIGSHLKLLLPVVKQSNASRLPFDWRSTGDRLVIDCRSTGDRLPFDWQS